MTYCSTYIGDLSDPSFHWDGGDWNGNIPRGIGHMTGLDVCQKLLQGGPLKGAARDPTIIIGRFSDHPAFVFLALDERFTGFALLIQAVKILLQLAWVSGWASIWLTLRVRLNSASHSREPTRKSAGVGHQHLLLAASGTIEDSKIGRFSAAILILVVAI
jgi:hypothetical protein